MAESRLSKYITYINPILFYLNHLTYFSFEIFSHSIEYYWRHSSRIGIIMRFFLYSLRTFFAIFCLGYCNHLSIYLLAHLVIWSFISYACFENSGSRYSPGLKIGLFEAFNFLSISVQADNLISFLFHLLPISVLATTVHKYQYPSLFLCWKKVFLLVWLSLTS